MDKNIAIEFENVGKQYRLGLVGTGSLQHDINRWWQTSILRREDPYLKIGEVNDRSTKGNSDYVWALKDISFKVEQGDVVGIIGKNGAGKSTLLKLLSHITAPSTGHISYRGRIASLLEVGTGFHPEMTARENIYMNGSIMGMTKAEITRKLDEIVDFAGIERYLDTPVKRFSSGMTVRLGFAVAAHLEPEILVVDEVLAVGDAEFQKKAIGKMQDISTIGGRTVLFVSHNMTAIKNLCKSCVMLRNGTLYALGNTISIVSQYLNEENVVENYDLSNITDFNGNGKLRVGKIKIHSEGDENGLVINDKAVSICFEVLNPYHISGHLEIAGRINNEDMIYVHYFASRLKSKLIEIPPEDNFYVEVHFENLPLTPGTYYMSIELMTTNKELLYYRDRVIKFQIEAGNFYGSGDRKDNGLVLIQQEWSVEPT